MKCIFMVISVMALAIALVVAVSFAAGQRCSFYSGGHIDPQGSGRLFQKMNPSFIPNWTIDSQYVVFNSQNVSHRNRTYIVSSDSSDLTTLSKYNDRYANSYSPNISSDGTEIVYTTLRHVTERENGRKTRNYEIEKARLDGSERTRLTTNYDIDAAPAWSPDGTSIAFVRESGDHRGIYTMSFDGSKERLIFPFDFSEPSPRYVLHHLSGPTWSSDGMFFAFSIEGPAEGPNIQELYIARSYGSWHRKVFSSPISAALDPRKQKYPISVPAWSPKDGILAFAVNGEGQNALYVIRPDEAEATKILGNYAGDQLAWSPDGQEILSSHGFAVKPDGTGFREIFQPGLSGWIAWSPDGNRIAVSTEDGRLITLNRDGSGMRKLVYADHYGELVLPDSPEERKSLDLGICIREPVARKPVVPEPHANPGLVNDCEALLRSRNTLDGISNLNWNEKQPISQWDGVIVRGDPPRVTKLWLNTRILTGAIPKELGLLTALEELDLSHNNISGGIPPEMTELKALKSLSLQGNALSGCIPIELPALWVDESGLERC